jgi:MSHA biogenesis protein MshM
MYYEFFGLTQAPFRITPNTEFFFSGGNRGPILEALIYAVTHGEGIVKVSGEVGSGKTMLCNMLMERLPQNVETVYIANPNVTPDEILHAIAFDLQLGSAPQATRLEVMRALQEYLLARYADGKRVVVFVEESQGMPLATLEEIRLLSNLETRNDKLLQIVLFGQPELDTNLRHPDIRQLRERITHSFTLGPLGSADIREYLMFRMRAAGYRGPELFSGKVVRLIARASAGLTRRVNLVADKALLAAFSENTHTLKPRHIEAALRDSEFNDVARGAGTARRWGWIAAALGGAAVGAAGYAWFIPHSNPQMAHAPAAAPPLVAAPAVAVKAAPPDAIAEVLLAAGVVAGDAPVAENTQPSVALPAPAPEPANSDILNQRLQAGAQWMSRQSDTVWTLQILASTSEGNLRDHLEALKKSIEINNIYVYRALGNGTQQPVYSVLYGQYDSQAAAMLELARLPAQLKSNGPWPRTVQSIHGKTN